jgi:Glycosyl transferase family 11
LKEYTGERFKYADRSGVIARLVKRFSRSYACERGFGYRSGLQEKIGQNCWVSGLWQDSRYFSKCTEMVKSSFKFRTFNSLRNIEIAKQMAETDSVAIHIRKSDGYGTWGIFKDTCPITYYKDAIAYFKRILNAPRFFVFTDAPEVARLFLDGEEYTLIDWNPASGVDCYLDMQLMSCAKNNIIANSTYSWWGAWLNGNENKVIVAPANWFNPNSGKQYLAHKIVPSDWVKL